MMKRREFITLVGGAALWPLTARAQQLGRIRRVGVLFGGDESDPIVKSRLAWFRQGLEELGWTDGRNLRLDLRWAAADPEADADLCERVGRPRPRRYLGEHACRDEGNATPDADNTTRLRRGR